MVVLMSISTWDQIGEFRSGRERDLVLLNYLHIKFIFNSRKLFEPKLFPNAGVLNIFDKFFGKFEDRDPREVRTLNWLNS